jgi:hypothetical protein
MAADSRCDNKLAALFYPRQEAITEQSESEPNFVPIGEGIVANQQKKSEWTMDMPKIQYLSSSDDEEEMPEMHDI